LFIASSSARMALVEAFQRELQIQAGIYDVGLEIQPWYHDVAVPGEDILTALTNHCRGNRDDKVKGSDFFAAFLTDDDFRAKGSGEQAGQTVSVPRDNVVFELGLFLGGLGFDLRRCFMLCSVPKSALPSDLDGRTYIRLDKPKGNTPLDYDNAVKSAAATVIRQVYEIKPYTAGGLESITPGELMDRERPTERDGDLQEDGEVLINRAQPIEQSSQDFAALVSKNIRDGITYRYFLHDLKAVNFITRLFHRVVTANPDDDGRPRKEPLSRVELEKHLHERVVRRFSINLLPKQGPIEFCIHNAHTFNGARCYVRDASQNKFVNLCQNQAALEVANRLKELEIESLPPRVFRRTQTFDLYHAEYVQQKTDLWNTIKERFAADWYPDLEATLKKVCFGEDPK
jgi:predicted nucleotide-binding protein